MKIGIVGDGQVGSVTAYTLALEGIAQEIVLIDLNAAKAEADSLDLTHAMAFRNDCQIYSGTYHDLDGADIVIITADAASQFKSSRLELLDGNVKMFMEMIPQIAEYAPFSTLIITTNPVDVMTYAALELSKFPVSHVIGAGTVLDSARFCSILSDYLYVSPQSIHGIVIGEHGDSAVISWSTACVGAQPIEEFAQQIKRPIDDQRKQQISEEVIDVPYRIFQGKQATSYGIASSLAVICRAIAKDQKKVLTVSSCRPDVEGIKNVCLSLPAVIGRDGVEVMTYPQLSDIEKVQLKKSAEVLDQAQNMADKIIQG